MNRSNFSGLFVSGTTRLSKWLINLAVLTTMFLLSISAEAAITLVATSNTEFSTGSNSRGLVIPTISTNDLLIAHVAIRGNRTITPPTGWTLIDNVFIVDGKLTQGLYYKVGLAAESGDTVNWSFNNSDDNAGVIRAYRGVDTSAPIGNFSGNTGSSSTLTASSISTTTANEWLLTFYGAADGRSSTFTTPGGMTERYDFDNGGSNNGLALAGDDEARPTAGPTGDRSTVSSRSDSYVAQLVALKPLQPTVISIARAASSPTIADTVSWTVTFNTSLSGVNSSNFSLVNSGLGGPPAIISVSGSGTTRTVTASTGTGIGTLGLNMVNTTGITPALSGLPFVGEIYQIVWPEVSSISLASTNPTTANSSVSWTVIFNGSVSGVDTGDFTLIETGGATGTSLTSVSGSGTTWTITANSGTSSTGTLGLNLIDNDTIVRSSGAAVPLGGAGAGNANYPGPFYTLVAPSPILGKTASTSAAVIGDVVTFTLSATNPYGTALTSVVLSDTLPTGMGYVTHVATLGSASAVGQIVIWTIPSLPAGGSAKLTLAVSLSQRGSLTNTVTSPGAVSASASILVLDSAVTHFRMDEPVASWTGAAGEVIDSGGTGLHGRRLTSISPTTTNVVSPSPTIRSQHSSVVGEFCNSASFDARGIVEVGDSPLFDYTTQLSASAWIYPTAYPSSGGLYSVLSNDVNYEFHIDSSGKLYWWWNSSTLTSATTIPLNQWTHVAITFDSSSGIRRQRIYINGVQDSNTNNWQGSLAPNNCNFYIGGDVATGASCSIISARNFSGMIDEVKLYSYELNASEVSADMTLGRACSGTFDHIRIEHDGIGSICAPERVTIKACLDSSCSTLYPGNVTVNLSPTGWIGGSTFAFSGGIATRQLSQSTSGAITLGTTSVSPIPGATTRCFNGASETCTLNFASASCAFDAVEPGAAPQTPIYTKLSGSPFNIDLLALLSSSSINTSYTGSVAVDLVDASGSACPTGAGLNTATSITFVSGDSGRKAVSFNYPDAARNVRVRATVGASAPACSTDNFTLRPPVFTIASTDATNTNMTGTPVIKAGAPFNLTASSVAGYDGTPSIDVTKLVGTPNAGTLGGVFSAAAALTGTASGTSFTYDNVGHFGLNQNAVFDSTFTTVDQPDDCRPDFSNTLTAGQYGCSIGSTAIAQTPGSSGFGRFIPAYFTLGSNTPSFDPVINSTFTYLGQPFPYLTSPALFITAVDINGNPTSNYDGAYWKMNSTLSSHSYINNAATASTVSINTTGTGVWSGIGAGTGTVTLSGEQLVYSKPITPEAPFSASVNLNFTASDLSDSDGVCYDADTPPDGICDTYSISTITGTDLRFGRATISDTSTTGTASGTIANVPLSIQYYDGLGFVDNTVDNATTVTHTSATPAFVCTDPDTSADTLTCTKVSITDTSATHGTTFPFILNSNINDGGGTLIYELANTILPGFLQFDWDGDGTLEASDQAVASVTFAPPRYYHGDQRFIYWREQSQ